MTNPEHEISPPIEASMWSINVAFLRVDSILRRIIQVGVRITLSRIKLGVLKHNHTIHWVASRRNTTTHHKPRTDWRLQIIVPGMNPLRNHGMLHMIQIVKEGDMRVTTLALNKGRHILLIPAAIQNLSDNWSDCEPNREKTNINSN